jgi:hypothetical protein
LYINFSQQAGANLVDEAFPEALKGPILRRVQFQTISRIDTLVDLIFDEFRNDYYPGEVVTVHVVSGERLTGKVRDKTNYGSKQMADGSWSAPCSQYFVSLDNRPDEEAVVDDAHIARDRKIFTKQVLRSFIKRKQKQMQQKVVPDYEGMVGSFQGNGPRLPELKPAPKSHKSKQQQQQLAKSKQQSFIPATFIPHPSQYNTPNPPYPSHTFQAVGSPQHAGPHQPNNFYNSTFAFAPLASLPPAPPPPPPIKYPIEDLQVFPRPNGPQRPALKFFSQDTPLDAGKSDGEGNGILMKSVGPLLESWDTLNVYCEVLYLDSFTFDDFVEAMQFTSEDVDCELFVEAHCAALKVLVGSEADGGKIYVQLPDMEEDDEDEDSEAEASRAPTPTPEPEPKPKGRATRSSLAKAEAEALKAEPPAKESTPEPKETHRAAEMQLEMNWIDRLKKRDFKNGGWQIIIIGLLNQISKNPRMFEVCETILKELAPLNMEPTPETAQKRYARLDVNHRIQALEIVCMLTAETRTIRDYMEECAQHMTGFRKEKIGYQRERKGL